MLKIEYENIMVSMKPFIIGIAFFLILFSSPLPAQHVVHLNQVQPDFKVRGPGTDEFGASIASGDVNGDGIDDLIVGDQMMDGAADHPGGVRIFYGRKFDSSSTTIELATEMPDLAIVGDEKYGKCGYFHTISCGDVSGDGIDDVVMGDPHSNGTVLVVFGNSDFSPNQVIDLAVEPADLTIEYSNSDGELGTSVGVTDFNGDGIMDILAGAPKLRNPRFNTYPGQVCMVYGSSGFPPNHFIDLSTESADLEIFGKADKERCGQFVAGGDINGDGYGDILMGAPYSGGGRVYVLFGEPNLPSGTVLDFAVADPPLTVLGEGGELGRVVSGDLNGDGYDELICSAPFRMSGMYYYGRVYVIKGKNSLPSSYVWNLNTTPSDVTIEATGWLGFSLSCGQISQDELDDLVIGRLPIVETLFGTKDLGVPNFIDLTQAIPDIRILDGPNKLGESVGVCDLNNDGFKDIAAGTRFGGASLNYHDAAWVVFAGGAKEYGEGVEGSGAVVPELSNEADELPVISTGNLDLTISNGLGGASGLLLFSLGKGSYPSYGGTFLLDPSTLFQMLPITLSNPGGGPGAGELTLPLSIPDITELNITPIYLQAGLNDPGAACGVSLTPGLQISFLSKGE